MAQNTSFGVPQTPPSPPKKEHYTLVPAKTYRANESIYLHIHRSGPLVENGLDKPKNRYGRYVFLVSTAFPYLSYGVDRARVSL